MVSPSAIVSAVSSNLVRECEFILGRTIQISHARPSEDGVSDADRSSDEGLLPALLRRLVRPHLGETSSVHRMRGTAITRTTSRKATMVWK